MVSGTVYSCLIPIGNGVLFTNISFFVTTAEVMRDKFVANNGCTPQTVTNVANGSHTHSCTTYQGCSSGHPLEWCSFDGIHQACEYDGASGDSVQKSWVPAEAWKFFTQF